MAVMGKLDGRVALITGGGTGIGRATALLFGREGARVMIAGRDLARAEAAAAEIAAQGGTAAAVACDVRDRAVCEAAVTATLDRFGSVDILFNNAGIVPYGTVLETSDAIWLDVFATNVHGTFYMSRAVLPIMIEQGRGTIVNNSSDWGVVGGQGAAAYAATKGAVSLLTKSMALDHARDGIRVNAVCPGDTVVDRWRTTWTAKGNSPETFDDRLQDLGDGFPIGRVAAPDEIAKAVLFLACDDSSYMTGHLLLVDGGNTAGGAATRYPHA
ncbi:MAG: SDR family oxidoreductase [Chloroflexi bacterium]|nr:SDR family oxidoreductase [Chloroflexota bacterium]